MCSIQMMLMPSSRSRLIVSMSDEHLLLGEAAGDLVEQKHLGLGRQRPRQFQTLALEQAQGLGEHVRAGQQPGAIERPGADLVRGLLGAGPAVGAADQHVLEDRHAFERLRDLVGARETRVATAVGRVPGDVLRRRRSPCLHPDG